MAGIGSILLFSRWLSSARLLRGRGVLIIGAAVLLTRLPKNIGETKKAQPRLLFRRRYWLYYVLLVFEGSRTAGVLSLQHDGSGVQLRADRRYRSASCYWQAASSISFSPGDWGACSTWWGERITLTVGYVALALCFVGYATVRNVWFLRAMVICINLLVTLSIGLSTYVNRIAPSEELTPTLSTGVSVNHITSVGMSFVAGALLPIVGYRALCWGAVVLIMLSVPFALAMQNQARSGHSPA